MDEILDELKRNNVNITMEVLTRNIDLCLKDRVDLFERMVSKVSDLLVLLEEVDVNSFGRAMAFLAFLYMYKRESGEVDIRPVVRLVAQTFHEIDYERYMQ